jgi:hypothetical protein
MGGYCMDSWSISQFIGLLVFVFILLASYAVLNYIFYSYPIYRFLQYIGYDKAWLAWIPFCKWFPLIIVSDDGKGMIKIGKKFYNRRNIAYCSIWGRIVCLFIPCGSLISYLLISMILGATCRDLYARVENKTDFETCVLGYTSGFYKMVLLAKLWQYLYQFKRRNRI